MLAHKLGKDVSLDEGNLLRKVLTKKGTGKGAQAKQDSRQVHCWLCGEGHSKWMPRSYGRHSNTSLVAMASTSPAVSYCVLSYQCAAAQLLSRRVDCSLPRQEPETRKEKAINIAKSQGFDIEGLNINTSGKVWEISEDGYTLIQLCLRARASGRTLTRLWHTVLITR